MFGERCVAGSEHVVCHRTPVQSDHIDAQSGDIQPGAAHPLLCGELAYEDRKGLAVGPARVGYPLAGPVRRVQQAHFKYRRDSPLRWSGRLRIGPDADLPEHTLAGPQSCSLIHDAARLQRFDHPGIPQIGGVLVEQATGAGGPHLISALDVGALIQIPAQPRREDVDAERVSSVLNLQMFRGSRSESLRKERRRNNSQQHEPSQTAIESCSHSRVPFSARKDYPTVQPRRPLCCGCRLFGAPLHNSIAQQHSA